MGGNIVADSFHNKSHITKFILFTLFAWSRFSVRFHELFVCPAWESVEWGAWIGCQIAILSRIRSAVSKRLSINEDIIKLDWPEKLVFHIVPSEISSKTWLVPASKNQLRWFFVLVQWHVECKGVLVQDSSFHQTVKKWNHIMFCELRISHTNYGIEIVLENLIFNDKSKHVVSKNELVGLVLQVS